MSCDRLAHIELHDLCACTFARIADRQLGLAVGGTLQLMMLGVASFGGASVPDFLTGAIVGTVFGALSGKGLEFSIGLAVPVGLLMVQLDILARFTNTILLHKVDKAIENLEDKKISKLILAGTIPWGLSRALPIFIMLILHFINFYNCLF